MQDQRPESDARNPTSATFGNTDWWTVRQAGRLDGPETNPARSALCQTYWKPLFQFVRRCGYSWHDAQDLTQEFFSRLLAGDSLKTADQDKGKFRSFLLTLLSRFLADQRDHQLCQKRGGGVRTISLQEGDTAFRQRIEPASNLNPEKLCERHWADQAVQGALARLEQECAARGKGRLFRALREAVLGENEEGYASAAAELGLTEANVRVTVHRLRQRLRELLTQTIAEPGERSTSREEWFDLYRAA